ncbi:MAG: UbiX family flavin prenyltransferase [Gammaproteobacteria bacterium]|nr:MAG: UbiX family flavin prenyltransferase [Gammaproteobacteria bacterium]
MPPRHVTLALTGASGVQYGLRLLEVLLGSRIRCSLLISKPAQVVIGMETDLDLPGRPAEQRRWLAERFNADPELLQVYGQEQWTAPIASGSAVADAMVVCPCTTGTLCNIAGGASRNLIERAADVSIKERRPLILVLRETPLSSIHLEHMLRLSQAGATIMPASPGFYHRPERLQDLVDFLVARILDHLHVEHELMPPWGAESS